MNLLDYVQVLALIIALGAIVFAVMRNYPLIIAMTVGILILALSMADQFWTVINIIGKTLIDYNTIELSITIGIIFLFGYVLRKTGFLTQIHISISRLFRSKKIAFLFVPALIGFLPGMGGAMISAPIVDEIGEDLGLSKVDRSAGNLVFRHFASIISPFGPTLILLASFTEIDLVVIIKTFFPLSLTYLALGYIFLLRNHAPSKSFEFNGFTFMQNLATSLYYLSPLISSFIMFLVFNFPLFISVFIGVIIAVLLGGKGKLDFKSTLKEGPDYGMMAGLFGLMVLREMVSNLDGLNTMLLFLRESGLSQIVIFIAIPLLLGWVSASLPTMVALTFTILIPLLPAENTLIYVMLIFFSGFTSYFFSPIHLCQILSNRYFNVPQLTVHRRQYPVLGLTYLTVLVLFGVSIFL